MAYAEYVPFPRRSIHKIKNTKENKKLVSVHFLMWKFCRELCGEDFCSVTWVSWRQVVWLPLSEDKKEETVMSEWSLYTCLHKVWKLHATCSLVFPADSLLLAKQMFLTEYSLAVCKQLLSETFPRTYTLLVHWYLSPVVLVTFCDPDCCKPFFKVSFLLNACLV